MAMDNMSIRRKHLEKLDEFVHKLYEETQTFKNYGVDLPDLEITYLHIHELIQEMLQCKTSEEFMEMIAELSKGIAAVLIVAVPQNAHQVANDLKGAHEAMSDMDVNEFLKNMQVKEKSAPPPAPPKSKEEREKDKDDLLDTLDLKKEVENSKPKKSAPPRPWHEKGGDEDEGEEQSSIEENVAPVDPPSEDDDTEETVTKQTDNEPQAKTEEDPLEHIWKSWEK